MVYSVRRQYGLKYYIFIHTRYHACMLSRHKVEWYSMRRGELTLLFRTVPEYSTLNSTEHTFSLFFLRKALFNSP